MPSSPDADRTRPGTPGDKQSSDGPGGFGAEVRETAGIWLVRVRGEVDLDTSPRLEAILTEAIDARPSQVIVELNSVSFLDSSGLRVLVEAQRRVEEQGAAFVIDGMSETVRRVLEVTGLLARLSASDD